MINFIKNHPYSTVSFLGFIIGVIGFTLDSKDPEQTMMILGFGLAFFSGCAYFGTLDNYR